MNEVPGVCIMIPTYNQAAYICKAVESALAQNYSNIEIVIADDGSTDNTAQLLQIFINNSLIKYKKNAANIGRVANYRKCLHDYTKAPWVINLDGDDYFTNTHFISEAMRAIQTSGTNDILFYQGVNIVKFGGKEKLIMPNIDVEENCITSEDYFFNFFKRNSFSHMSTLYNRQAAIENNFYETDIISTDIFSFLKLCVNNSDKKVIVSKNVSGVWYQHNANTSKTLSIKNHLNNWHLYTKLYVLAIAKGHNKWKCLKWLMKSGFIYARSYFYSLLKTKKITGIVQQLFF